jgi:hypothetical protein
MIQEKYETGSYMRYLKTDEVADVHFELWVAVIADTELSNQAAECLHSCHQKKGHGTVVPLL